MQKCVLLCITVQLFIVALFLRSLAPYSRCHAGTFPMNIFLLFVLSWMCSSLWCCSFFALLCFICVAVVDVHAAPIPGWLPASHHFYLFFICCVNYAVCAPMPAICHSGLPSHSIHLLPAIRGGCHEASHCGATLLHIVMFNVYPWPRKTMQMDYDNFPFFLLACCHQ